MLIMANVNGFDLLNCKYALKGSRVSIYVTRSVRIGHICTQFGLIFELEYTILLKFSSYVPEIYVTMIYQ